MGFGLAVAAALPLLLAPPPDERSRMTVPALSIFQGMLRFADAGEAEKVQRSLALLGPVLAEHERAFGPASSGALVDLLSRAADRGTLLQGVRALVARDVLALLLQIGSGPSDRARTLVRTAALEWGLLEGAALQQDLRAAQALSAQLRDLRDAVDAGDLRDAAAAVPRLQADLVSLFPAPKAGS